MWAGALVWLIKIFWILSSKLPGLSPLTYPQVQWPCSWVFLKLYSSPAHMVAFSMDVPRQWFYTPKTTELAAGQPRRRTRDRPKLPRDPFAVYLLRREETLRLRQAQDLLTAWQRWLGLGPQALCLTWLKCPQQPPSYWKEHPQLKAQGWNPLGPSSQDCQDKDS